MGTAYESICGCLTSAPEPDDYDSSEYHAWGARWATHVEAHHPYCCQEQRQAGGIDRCLVGQDATCPVLAKSREMRRLAAR